MRLTDSFFERVLYIPVPNYCERRKLKLYHILIVEDDKHACQYLLQLLKDEPDIESVRSASSGSEALPFLQNDTADLVFLDIHLPDITGMELLEKLERVPYIIFMTVDEKYARKAFDVGAVDFLLKPFSRERLKKSLERFRVFFQSSEKETLSSPLLQLGLTLQVRDKHYFLPYNKVVYLSAHNKKTIIHLKDSEVEINRYLGDIQAELPESFFSRIHKQFIINNTFFSHYQYFSGGRYMVYLDDDEETVLPIGRKYFPEFKNRYRGK